MKTKLNNIACLLAITALGGLASTTTVRADSAHFIKGPTASYDSTTGDLCVSFKEAGLGSTSVTYTITADPATFTVQCFTKAGNQPQGSPNSVTLSHDSGQTTLTPRNGSITGSLCLIPEKDGASCQGNGLVLKLTAANYTDVYFCDSTNNVCVSLGNQGGSVTPPVKF